MIRPQSSVEATCLATARRHTPRRQDHEAGLREPSCTLNTVSTARADRGGPGAGANAQGRARYKKRFACLGVETRALLGQRLPRRGNLRNGRASLHRALLAISDVGGNIRRAFGGLLDVKRDSCLASPCSSTAREQSTRLRRMESLIRARGELSEPQAAGFRLQRYFAAVAEPNDLGRRHKCSDLKVGEGVGDGADWSAGIKKTYNLAQGAITAR
jgi:hypothetical protein